MERLGAAAFEVRTYEDLERAEGLILPGGESTAMLKLLDYGGLFEVLHEFGRRKPIFGTCAGAILIASEVTNPSQPSLQLMDISVERNGYGRQLDSHIATLDVEGRPVEAVFIRAPVIRRTGPGVRALAAHRGNPVLVDDGRHLAATFHPELSASGESASAIHERFLRRVQKSR